MLSIAQPYYALQATSQLKWTATQENTLNREYPFPDIQAETPELYVQRIYLQFLWLPEVRVFAIILPISLAYVLLLVYHASASLGSFDAPCKRRVLVAITVYRSPCTSRTSRSTLVIRALVFQ